MKSCPPIHSIHTWPLDPRPRLVDFDLPVFAGVNLRDEPLKQRCPRLELPARAFMPPLELSPLVPPSRALTTSILGGELEGTKDRISASRPGLRTGWSKVKSPDWYARHRRRIVR